MPKLPTEFRTSFSIVCECGQELHGTISTTGFQYLPVSRLDEINIDFSKAETLIHYENDITNCPQCGKALKTTLERKGDDEIMGKPSKGTPADQRLKENKPKTAVKPAPAPMKKGK